MKHVVLLGVFLVIALCKGPLHAEVGGADGLQVHALLLHDQADGLNLDGLPQRVDLIEFLLRQIQLPLKIGHIVNLFRLYHIGAFAVLHLHQADGLKPLDGRPDCDPAHPHPLPEVRLRGQLLAAFPGSVLYIRQKGVVNSRIHSLFCDGTDCHVLSPPKDVLQHTSFATTINRNRKNVNISRKIHQK